MDLSGIGPLTVPFAFTQRVTEPETGEWDVLMRAEFISVTEHVITYKYDGLYRLVEADYSSGEGFEYVYDAVGNRTTDTATITSTQVTTYTYDAANRLVNLDGTSYTWDSLGQLIHDGTFTYTWNAAGRLITVTDGTDAYGFEYDGDGNRLAYFQHLSDFNCRRRPGTLKKAGRNGFQRRTRQSGMTIRL